MAMPGPALGGGAAAGEQGKAEQDSAEMEEGPGFEYWGYLFKQDKTGTDKLKALLRGLKAYMNEQYQPEHSHTDRQPDLTPDQLARFYRDLDGNYDQLFLGTPSESIAFIYQSLGCLHSLQPQRYTHGAAFTEPVVPALKTEGWIMWQTIQLLLGPDEHYAFLSEAVSHWDIKDISTGESFPRILPRRCFPMEPDKHMVAWYEGVSERLRKEAEEEGRMREVEAERAEVRRLRHQVEDAHLTDDEAGVDSRGPALAYFRNPLYRHVDGRPSIVRRGSKRPTLSPRHTMVDRGKEAAISAGHVIRKIGSPHLWDGRSNSRHASRERDQESRDRRRRSLPDHRHSAGPIHHPGDPPPASAGAYESSALSPHEGARHRRRRSSHPQGEAGGSHPATAATSAGSDADESNMYTSPRPSPLHHHHHRPNHLRRDSHLRPSRSAEPTPSQKEGDDYFQGYDALDRERRRTSAYDQGAPETPPISGGGVGFGPSASPLFATHVARNPPPPPAGPPPTSVSQARPPPPRDHSPDTFHPMRNTPSIRRTQERPYSQSPDRRPGCRDEPRQYESPRRRRFEQSPAGYDDGLRDPRGPPLGQPPTDGRHRHSHSIDVPYNAPHPPGLGMTTHPGPGSRRGPGRSGDDMPPPSPPFPQMNERRQGRPKMARFNEPLPMGPPPGGRFQSGHRRSVSRGVDGRRYVDESPWSRN